MTKTNEAVNLKNTIQHKLTTKKLSGALDKIKSLSSALERQSKITQGQFASVARQIGELSALVEGIDKRPSEVTQAQLDDLEDRLNTFVRLSFENIVIPEIPEYDETPIKNLEKPLADPYDDRAHFPYYKHNSDICHKRSRWGKHNRVQNGVIRH